MLTAELSSVSRDQRTKFVSIPDVKLDTNWTEFVLKKFYHRLELTYIWNDIITS